MLWHGGRFRGAIDGGNRVVAAMDVSMLVDSPRWLSKAPRLSCYYLGA